MVQRLSELAKILPRKRGFGLTCFSLLAHTLSALSHENVRKWITCGLFLGFSLSPIV